MLFFPLPCPETGVHPVEAQTWVDVRECHSHQPRLLLSVNTISVPCTGGNEWGKLTQELYCTTPFVPFWSSCSWSCCLLTYAVDSTEMTVRTVFLRWSEWSSQADSSYTNFVKYRLLKHTTNIALKSSHKSLFRLTLCMFYTTTGCQT